MFKGEDVMHDHHVSDGTNEVLADRGLRWCGGAGGCGGGGGLPPSGGPSKAAPPAPAEEPPPPPSKSEGKHDHGKGGGCSCTTCSGHGALSGGGDTAPNQALTAATMTGPAVGGGMRRNG